MTPREVVHIEPVWRDKADFILAARLPELGYSEQLWGRQLANHRFELCCIPFFVYDLALGDIVETDELYDLTRVAQPSGRWVFRVSFHDFAYSSERVAAELHELGALLERLPPTLLAVDAPDHPTAQLIADLLQQHEKNGHLVYETGRTA